MPCGCNKRTAATRGAEVTAESRALTASTAVYHEVWIGDRFTGRRFTSLLSATRYATSIGGTVHASS